MKKHEILSPQSRAALFDPPTDPAAIVRHYTFSPEELALIRQRRRDANRLGFAVHLAYLQFPGRVLGSGEIPPADMLAFIAGQLEHRARRLSANTHSEPKHVGSISANCKLSWRSPLSTRGLSTRREDALGRSDRH